MRYLRWLTGAAFLYVGIIPLCGIALLLNVLLHPLRLRWDPLEWFVNTCERIDHWRMTAFGELPNRWHEDGP